METAAAHSQTEKRAIIRKRCQLRGKLEDEDWAILLRAEASMDLSPMRTLSIDELMILENELQFIQKREPDISHETICSIRKLTEMYCCGFGIEVNAGLASMIRIFLTVEFSCESSLLQAMHNFRERFTSPHLLSYTSLWNQESFGISPSENTEGGIQHNDMPTSSSSSVDICSLRSISPFSLDHLEASTQWPLHTRSTPPPLKWQQRERKIAAMQLVISEIDQVLVSLFRFHLPRLTAHFQKDIDIWPSDFAFLWCGTAFAFGCSYQHVSTIRTLWEYIIMTDERCAVCILACVLLARYSKRLSATKKFSFAYCQLKALPLPFLVKEWWIKAAEFAKRTPTTFSTYFSTIGMGFFPLAAIGKEETLFALNSIHCLTIAPSELISILKRRASIKRFFAMKDQKNRQSSEKKTKRVSKNFSLRISKKNLFAGTATVTEKRKGADVIEEERALGEEATLEKIIEDGADEFKENAKVEDANAKDSAQKEEGRGEENVFEEKHTKVAEGTNEENNAGEEHTSATEGTNEENNAGEERANVAEGTKVENTCEGEHMKVENGTKAENTYEGEFTVEERRSEKSNVEKEHSKENYLEEMTNTKEVRIEDTVEGMVNEEGRNEKHISKEELETTQADGDEDKGGLGNTYSSKISSEIRLLKADGIPFDETVFFEESEENSATYIPTAVRSQFEGQMETSATSSDGTELQRQELSAEARAWLDLPFESLPENTWQHAEACCLAPPFVEMFMSKGSLGMSLHVPWVLKERTKFRLSSVQENLGSHNNRIAAKQENDLNVEKKAPVVATGVEAPANADTTGLERAVCAQSEEELTAVDSEAALVKSVEEAVIVVDEAPFVELVEETIVVNEEAALVESIEETVPVDDNAALVESVEEVTAAVDEAPLIESMKEAIVVNEEAVLVESIEETVAVDDDAALVESVEEVTAVVDEAPLVELVEETIVVDEKAALVESIEEAIAVNDDAALVESVEEVTVVNDETSLAKPPREIYTAKTLSTENLQEEVIEEEQLPIEVDSKGETMTEIAVEPSIEKVLPVSSDNTTGINNESAGIVEIVFTQQNAIEVYPMQPSTFLWYLEETLELWDMTILDSRSPEEIAQAGSGYIKGSVNIYKKLLFNPSSWGVERFVSQCLHSKGKVFCFLTGDDSVASLEGLTSFLAQEGISRLCVVQGGWKALYSALLEAGLSESIVTKSEENVLNIPIPHKSFKNIGENALAAAQKFKTSGRHVSLQTIQNGWSSLKEVSHSVKEVAQLPEPAKLLDQATQVKSAAFNVFSSLRSRKRTPPAPTPLPVFETKADNVTQTASSQVQEITEESNPTSPVLTKVASTPSEALQPSVLLPEGEVSLSVIPSPSGIEPSSPEMAEPCEPLAVVSAESWESSSLLTEENALETTSVVTVEENGGVGTEKDAASVSTTPFFSKTARKLKPLSLEKNARSIFPRRRPSLFGRTDFTPPLKALKASSSSVTSSDFSPTFFSVENVTDSSPEYHATHDGLSPLKKSFKHMFGNLSLAKNFSLELKGLDAKAETSPPKHNDKKLDESVENPSLSELHGEGSRDEFEEFEEEENDEEDEDEALGVFEIGDDDLDEVDSFFGDSDDFGDEDSVAIKSDSENYMAQYPAARNNAMDLMQNYRKLVNELNGWNKHDVINFSQVNAAMKQMQTTADGFLVFKANKVYKQKQRSKKFSRKEVDKEEFQKRLLILCLNHLIVASQIDEETFDSLPTDDESSKEEGTSLLPSSKVASPQSTVSTSESEFALFPSKRWKANFVSTVKAFQEKKRKFETIPDIPQEISEENVDDKAGVVELEDNVPFRAVIKSNRRIKTIKELQTAVDGRKRRVKLVHTNGKENEYDIVASDYFARTLKRKMDNIASSLGSYD